MHGGNDPCFVVCVGGVSAGRRRLAQVQPRLANGSDIVLGQWHLCGVTSFAEGATLAVPDNSDADAIVVGGAGAGIEGAGRAAISANMYVTYQLLPSGYYSFQVRGREVGQFVMCGVCMVVCFA